MPDLPDSEDAEDSQGLLQPAREEDPISPLDKLVSGSPTYRSGPGVKALFDFILRSSHLSLADATLLHAQNPEMVHPKSAASWENRYARRVRPDARAYVIHGAKGAAAQYFDVGDTEPLNPADDRVPPRVSNPFPARSQPPEGMLERLLYACTAMHIWVERRDFKIPPREKVSRMGGRPWAFRVELNSNHSPAQQIGTLTRELAHIFCGHFGVVKDGYWVRYGLPSGPLRDFESEAVAYLVTGRLSVDVAPTNYLADFLDGDKPIPEYSLDAVLQAAEKIEDILRDKRRFGKDPTAKEHWK